MKTTELLFLIILIYSTETNNNVIGKKVAKKYTSLFSMNKSIKYLVQNDLDKTENIVEAHEIIGNETCLKFARTFDLLETDATFVKKGRKCSSTAYIMGNYIGFSITVNEYCMISEMIQKLILWSLHMRYQFSKCLGDKNVEGQENIKEKYMKDVIKNYKCDVKSVKETTITIKEHYLDYSNMFIPKKDNFYPQLLSQIDYSKRISFLDLKDLNDKICKDSCSKSSAKYANYGYSNPHNCSAFLCPFFYDGKYCKDYTKSKEPKKCGPGLLKVSSKLKKKKLNLKAECFYQIVSSSKKKKIKVKFKLSRPMYWNCNANKFFEVKYYKDKSKDGVVLCAQIKTFTIKSSIGASIFVYHSFYPYDGFDITMEYRI